MELKNIAIGFAVVLLAAAAWECRDAEVVQAWMRPPSKPVPIVFDNGTVRRYEAASQPEGVAAALSRRADGLKKCRRGDETIYTNFECPPGSKPAALAGGTVTVVTGTETPKPRLAASPGTGQSTLRDALDLSGNENLRDKRMERLIEHGSTVAR